jgi:hypothetical protein
VLPWQASPDELALPSARSGSTLFQSGTNLYLIGGETSNGTTADVLLTETTEDGNFAPWIEGPALPEPRSDATLGTYLGIPYVIGGLDAAGQATDTVFKGLVEDGLLTGWELANGEDGTDPLTLPAPISGAGVSVGTSGFVLVGGRDAEGAPIDDVHVAWVGEASSSGRLLEWKPLEGLNIPEARANPVVADVGSFIYVVGGEGPEGATSSVYRLQLHDQEPGTDEFGKTLGWATAPPEQMLPEARALAVGFESNGSVYVIGGIDEAGDPTDTTLWAVSDQVTGGFDEGWQDFGVSDLKQPVADAPIAGVGATAFIFGGITDEGTSDGTMRAGLSPRAPFFQLGIAGATLPALSIKGEVGQQLGYLNAMGVGMANFVILILIGVAFSHQAASRRVISRLSGGRLKVEPKDEYGP